LKSLFTLVIPFLCIAYAGLSQSISINETGAAPHGSAILDISNAKKGFLPPRMTTAQRDSIQNPANGLVIFNLTAGSLNYFFGGSWYEWKGKVTYPAGTIHCKATPTTVVEVINPATGRTWMDRNFGASRVAISSTDSLAYGDLYQWGRRADGHQCRNSATTTILSSTDKPANGDFIIANSGNYDWRNPQNDNLWQGVNGINNPCPSGYRIPSETEWNEERLSWSSNDAGGAFTSPLKLTLAGKRSIEGFLSDAGNDGYYYSGTINGIAVKSLLFNSNSGSLLNVVRSLGYTVRCIKEPLIIQGSIQSLDCSNAINTGTLIKGQAASGVISKVKYTGGNGGIHAGQTVPSSGVTGLTATLGNGSFSSGADTLVYTITGTPSDSGTASFSLNIGGQTCTLTRTVGTITLATYPAGTIHCTATPTAVVDVLNPATGKTWMDRNLGASRAAISSNDSLAYGDLYQWGRRADGHQCRNSATTTTLSSVDQPIHSSYILAPVYPFDWRSPQNDNLWQGVNGINNPCPSGYRLPTDAELIAERLSWSSNNATGAINSPLKLPLAGQRYGSGSIFGEGTNAYYWSSSVSINIARILIFTGDNANMMTGLRADGSSVRCIKQSAQIQGSINGLDCNASTPTGTLTQGQSATGVSNSVPYSGGNGGNHAGQTVASTGVAGLTATLASGSFANGAGALAYTISGTPASSGFASFALNIGGQNCTLTRLVNAGGPAYPAGTVHCTPTPTAVIEVINPTTGRTWMDRNLGASRVATSSTDADGYGDLYQWGRRADGHQCRNSATTNTLSSTDQPPHGNFILEPGLTYDWRNPKNDNLWQGVNGVNNPCPTGYRIPTETEWIEERLSWSSKNAGGAFASPLKFTASGTRLGSDGSLQLSGTNGTYWSSTTSEIFALTLSFDLGIAFVSTGFRGNGVTVRCIKENSIIQGSINMLDCNTSTPTGTLTQGQAATGVSNSVPYSGGNGGNHAGQTVTSTGVTGLTANLSAGSFVNGAGTLVYTISGTPASSGIANFALNIGGQNCTLTRLVNAGGPAYPAGTVHCTPTPTAVVEVLNPATGRTWMDRNLGASRAAISSNDSAAYGDLYQWGRRADGHQCRNSATTTTLSSTDQPPHGNFIFSANSPIDWRSPQNDNLWQGVNGINNPCPSGYRVPTTAELNAERASWTTQNIAGAFASPLKLPKAGRRFATWYGTYGDSTLGLYWTSLLVLQNVSTLFFGSSNSMIVSNVRADGASVRCIKEAAITPGSITGLDCQNATATGTLTQGEAANGVSSSVPFGGGNGGPHTGQTVASTGVVGLTATLAAGSFTNAVGTLLYTISGTPTTSGTAIFALNIGGLTCSLLRTVNAPAGSIATLNCNGATPTGTLTQGQAATGVNSSVPYTGGNGGSHAGQTVASTGVTGLTANLSAGSFANGAGSLVYTISGTPASSGIANFALNIGGQNCTLTRLVNAAGPAYPAGTVHCTPGPTAVIEVVNPATGRTWMDRNLGASRVAISSTDAEAYGDLYQWGRRADRHQCRNSGTTSVLSTTDQPAHGNFILEPGLTYDWRNPRNDNLWQGVNGVNNPCPIGYRLPTVTELDAERVSWSSQNSAGAFATPLKLPVAGYRSVSDGSLNDVGNNGLGLYWSSTAGGTLTNNLFFHSGDSGMSGGYRAHGFSVRCIKN
jgi:uncharacterized protein (TIGR02145 family)